MPERQAFIDQIKGIERESYVIVAAVSCYRPLVEAGEVKLPLKASLRDLVAAIREAEATYLIRMWAAFEMCLRSYYLKFTGHDSIQANNLVDWTAGIKQGRSISSDVRKSVHGVREYRNYLVHGSPAPSVMIEEARKVLNTLLQCLPMFW